MGLSAIGYRLSAMLLLVLAAMAVPAAPHSLAQSGCAAPAGIAPRAAPAQRSPGGTIGLSYDGSLGGDTNAVASLGGTGTIIFSRGADLALLSPPNISPVSIHLPDLIRDIAVGSAALYVAAGTGGLQIIDRISGQVQGALYPPGLTAAVAIDGQRAYLAAAGPGGGLQVADVSDSSRPRLLGSAPTYGSATALAHAGGRAYVAEGLGGGIQIFDVSDPRAPALRGGLITPGAARGVAVSGGRAYVAAGQCGLQVLDVADPSLPRLLGAVATGGDARAIQIGGGRAYVAAGDAGLVVFDLGGDLPQRVAGRSFGALAPISDVFLDGGFVHLAAGAAGTTTVEAAIPALRLVGGASTISGVRKAQTANGFIYMALGDGGFVADTGAFSDDAFQGDSRSKFPALNLAIGPTIGTDTILYTAGGDAGLRVIRASFGTRLADVGGLALPGATSAILVDGDRAYAAAGGAGVHILSLTNPLTPTLQKTVDTPGAALDLASAGGLLYVADGGGMRVIDPTTAAIVGSYAAPAGAFIQSVAVGGGRAYLADRSGVIVLDVSDPTKPTPLPGVAGFSAYGLALRGGQLFVAAGKDGVLAFDVSNPSGPRLAGAFTTPGTALGVTLSGDTLLVSDSEGGLLRLRVTALPFQSWVPQVSR